MNKPIILTNFGYQRSNWIAPIEAIRDKFEVIYIHFIRREDEYAKYTDAKILYFSDFKNAQELLETTRPNIFIAMGLNSTQAYAIKLVCNKRNIPFVYMDHGLYGQVDDFKKKMARHSISKKDITKTNQDSHRYRNFGFAFSTFINAWAFIKLTILAIQFIYSKILKRPLYYNSLHNYLSRPDKFITYSQENNRIMNFLYKPSNSCIYVIGNFEYDKFRVEPDKDDIKYALFIDSPLSDNPSNRHYFSNDKHTALYQKANEFAIEHGLKLKIKLHPYNYYSKWLIEDSNIEYLRNVDLNKTIKNAQYSFSFYSTLLIPSLYFVPTIVIKVQEHSFIDFIEKNKLSNVYSVDDFLQKELAFTPVQANRNTEFRNLYFNLEQASSIDRLRSAINDIITY